MNNDLKKLLDKLPFYIDHDNLLTKNRTNQLVEIILDLGRRPEARFSNYSEYLSKRLVSWHDLDNIVKSITKFNDKNRAGIEKTLHRVSCIRNRQFAITGITFRVGRSTFGSIPIIRDLLEFEESILIIGKPGVGKTTVIREISRVLSNEIEKRVIIIDTSNEIAGESNTPHLSIGKARQMQVTKASSQHKAMIEAVENHMPQVIIIDEISTDLEVLAARTIAEKGVQLISTIHGSCLENLIKNPFAVDLIGGIESVTLSDDEAKRRKTQKTILERRSDPVFNIVIEINKQNFWTIYEDVKTSIDSILYEGKSKSQIRLFSLAGNIKILSKPIFVKKKLLIKTWDSKNKEKYFHKLPLKPETFTVYTYSISNNLLKEVLLRMGITFTLTNEIRKANIIIGLKKHLNKNVNLIRFASKHRIPIYSFNYISYYKLVRLFSRYK